MPLTYQRKITVEVDYLCDKCGAGNMRSTGVVLTSNPPWYPHVCNVCGAKENMLECYPRIEYMNALPAARAQGRGDEHS